MWSEVKKKRRKRRIISRNEPVDRQSDSVKTNGTTRGATVTEGRGEDAETREERKGLHDEREGRQNEDR